MKLVKIRALFLSPSFLPFSSVTSHWSIVHEHIPPSTFSGLMFRGLLFAFNSKALYGDYIPCAIGEGLLAKLVRSGPRLLGTEWTKAGKAEEKPGYRPPYIEHHFRAIVHGAYPVSILKGHKPGSKGVAEKYWNVIKYIDNADEHLRAPIVVGIKTWHYSVMDGARLYEMGKKREVRYQIYDVVKVKHVLVLEDIYGFILVDDSAVEEGLRRLQEGWFIAKSRLKTLVAVKTEEFLEEMAEKPSQVDYAVPFLRKPTKPTYAFASSVLDLDAVRGKKRDALVVNAYLYATTEPLLDRDRLLFFEDRNGRVYAVDKEWLNYLGP